MNLSCGEKAMQPDANSSLWFYEMICTYCNLYLNYAMQYFCCGSIEPKMRVQVQ